MRKKNTTRICKNCQKEFKCFQSDVNRGKGIFCGNSCTTSYRNRMTKKTTEQIFLSNIVKQANDCWEYQKINTKGYGRISISKNKIISAHRYSYMYFVDKNIAGLYICHKCDNKKCVNPKHLYAGNAKDNAKDREERSIIRRKIGQEHYKSKLSDDDVRQIKLALKQGVLGKDLAKQYNVTPFCISAIKLNKSWKHLEAT